MELKLNISRTVLFLIHYHKEPYWSGIGFCKCGGPVYMEYIELTYYNKWTYEEITKNINTIFAYEGFPKEMVSEAERESWFNKSDD